MGPRRRRGGSSEGRERATPQARPRPDAGGRRSCCKRFLVAILLFEALVGLFAWVYPSPIQPLPFRYSNDSDPELVGPLAVNDLLKRGERLFEDEIVGPEALVVDDDGGIYTGLSDGRIIRVDKELKSFSTIIRTGVDSDQCGKVGSAIAETMCGRPLGMVFDGQNSDQLYVIDSSLGLLEVNVRTKSLKTLVSKNSSAVPVNFLNDLVQLPNGSLLITDSSLKFSRHDNVLEGLECGANGQLLVYDPREGSLDVALTGLHFPNGLGLTGDGESVLIVETTRARILRYYFAGRRAGAIEVFSDNLPSWPDNVTPSSGGGFWVGNALLRSPVLNYFAHSMVSVRSLLAKFHLVPLLEMAGLLPAHGLILELDEKGSVVRSLHDKGGDVTATTSHILELGDSLLVGSYHAPYLIRVKL